VRWAVRWHCRYPVSCRDLKTTRTEHGVGVDHTTICCWVQRYSPEMEQRLCRQRMALAGCRGRPERALPRSGRPAPGLEPRRPRRQRRLGVRPAPADRVPVAACPAVCPRPVGAGGGRCPGRRLGGPAGDQRAGAGDPAPSGNSR